MKQPLSVKLYNCEISQIYFICTSGFAEACVRLIKPDITFLTNFQTNVLMLCKKPFTLIPNWFCLDKVFLSYWFVHIELKQARARARQRQNLCLTDILPTKSTRIHSSSSFSLNSGSWLDKLSISPMSMLFNLWNITKAGTRLWLVGLYIQGSRHSSHSTSRVAQT